MGEQNFVIYQSDEEFFRTVDLATCPRCLNECPFSWKYYCNVFYNTCRKALLKIRKSCHARDLWKLTLSCKTVAFTMHARPMKLPLTQWISKLPGSNSYVGPVNIFHDFETGRSTEGWINIKIFFYQYKNSHYKDKMVSLTTVSSLQW